MAAALIGEPTRAAEYLAALNPARRTASRRGAVRYRIEPYVLAGDVYSTAPHAGRGGWSWYTGAAAWYWRAVIECVLGLKIGAESICVTPRLPDTWIELWRQDRGGGRWVGRRIALPHRVRAFFGGRGASALLDGEAVDASAVPLQADGREHVLQIRLPVGPIQGR